MTFYIGNKQDEFIRDDPWTVVEDNEDGCICYIDQLITDKDKNNPGLSYSIWAYFKEYIIDKYPNVNEITWARYNFKTGGRHVYCKNIRR